MKLLLTLFFIALIHSLSAQSISTSTVNIGGNTAVNKNFQIDWSIGEGCSIASFTSNNNLLITTGVLQPTYLEKIFINNLTPNWLSEEISVYPQPSKDFFEVNFKLETIGNIQLELLDQFGRKLITKKLYYNRSNTKERFEIANLSSGIYFLNALMTADGDKIIIRKGIYKIIKL